MVEQNTFEQPPVAEFESDSVSDRRTKTLRARKPRFAQDDIPHQAADRRQPARAAVALEHAQICARVADDNRGKDILLLDLKKTTPIVDYFVIITAVSRRLCHAMASEIDHEMKKIGETKIGLEGSEEGRWVLIDYGDFVVHIFSPEDRAYYGLEDIWGDAPRLEWQLTRPDKAVAPSEAAPSVADAAPAAITGQDSGTEP